MEKTMGFEYLLIFLARPFFLPKRRQEALGRVGPGPGLLPGILVFSWEAFGLSWAAFGEVWRSLGSFLAPFWKHFWKIICHLEQNVKIAKNQRKPMVFHRFLRFWEGPGAWKFVKKLSM